MKRILALLSLFTALTIASANADIYLRFTNSSIPTEGESTTKGRENWIDATSFSFGLETVVNLGGGGGISSGKAQFQALEITKNVDKSSPALMTATATGSHYGDLVLEVTRQNADLNGEIVFFKIEMKDVLIESVQSGFSDGDDRIEENVVIIYGSHKITTYSTNPKTGEVTVSGTHQWSIITNTPQL